MGRASVGHAGSFALEATILEEFLGNITQEKEHKRGFNDNRIEIDANARTLGLWNSLFK
jgi:hypothetical protein